MPTPVSVFSRGHRSTVTSSRAAPGAESSSARRFGELLAEEAVITHPGSRGRRSVGVADDRGLETHLGLQIEIVTTTFDKLEAAMHRLYGPPVAHEVDVFGAATS
jgi:hypothetical protein